MGRYRAKRGGLATRLAPGLLRAVDKTMGEGTARDMSWASWAVVMIVAALSTAAIWRASGGLQWFGVAAGVAALAVAAFAGVSALDLAGGSIDRLLAPLDRAILSMLDAFGRGAIALTSTQGASFWLFVNAAILSVFTALGLFSQASGKPRAAGRIFAPAWRRRDARGRGLIGALVGANAFILVAGPDWLARLVGW